MSEAPGRECFLRAEIALVLRDLEVDARFSLTAPWTVLFGPSGAGKTSLLRALLGLSPAGAPPRPIGSGGRRSAVGIRSTYVSLGGRVLANSKIGFCMPPRDRRIGYLAQRPALFPHMDAQANVEFGLHGISRTERRARAREMLALVSAEPLAGRMPAMLSGGERQRIALARALAPAPSLLLLDEPFTGLDGRLKDSILANLTGWLGKRKIPALYVTHDVAEAFQTQGEAIVLDRGSILAQGPPRTVLARERERLLRRLDAEAGKPHSLEPIP